MSYQFIPVVDLQASAVDLARRLTFLQHFPLAASELLTCEKLPEDEIRRQSRKIVTLIEIGRNALTRAGLKLYRFVTCRPELRPHKDGYFSLLEMLKKIRPRMDDSNLEARINKLLLPLSTYLRISVPEKPEESPSATSPPLRMRLSLSPPPYHSRTATAPRTQSAALAGSMPPPDDVSGWNRRIHSSIGASRGVGHRSDNKRRTPSRPIIQPTDPSSDDEDSDEEPLPVVIQRPRPRFGILCTSKPQAHHDRIERTITTTAY